MRISLNWLSDYVDVSMKVSDLAELLTTIGLNCEEIIETPSDIILDLEVTSNRSDCLGHIGVARELAAATGGKFRPPRLSQPPTGGNVRELTGVEVTAPDLCPRYTARVISGVKVAASPSWLIERIEAAGLRTVNNVVDVTNYVLMEYSQPLHSFDYDKLAGGRIVVRRGLDGETMVSIDQTTCRLDSSMLVIADATRAVAVAGIMGGLDTEVTESTVNVLIESAQFDPLTTRRTSRKLGLMSESNYRFERGVDPVALERASLRACGLIVELAGGTLADGVVDVWAQPFDAPRVELRVRRCNDLLGVNIPADRQREILDALGLSATLDGGAERQIITCTIPPHRPDISREADLIEEVARIHGFDRIPVRPHVTHTVTDEGRTQKARRRVTSLLAAAGFDEAVTFTFCDVEEAALFGCDRPLCADRAVRKTNNALRPTLLTGLLRACKVNQDAGNAEVSLFELAGIFYPHPSPSDSDAPPGESVELAMATTGDLRVLRGAIDSLLEHLAPDGGAADIRPADLAGLAGGQAAEIYLGPHCIGSLGLISAAVRDHYGLERVISAARLKFSALSELSQRPRRFQPVAKFPPAGRDLSLVVDEAVTWQELRDAISAVDQPLRVDTSYVTTYRGRQIPDGRKSVTVRLTYRSDDGTLRGGDVDAQVAELVSALDRNLSAVLRT